MLTIKDFRKPQETWDVDDPRAYTPYWQGDAPFTIWRIGSCTFYPLILEDELISSNAIPEENIYACTMCHARYHKTSNVTDICHFCCGAGVTISYNYLRGIVNEHS